MTVYREEVYLRVKDENRKALETNNHDLLAATQLWQSTAKK